LKSIDRISWSRLGEDLVTDIFSLVTVAVFFEEADCLAVHAAPVTKSEITRSLFELSDFNIREKYQPH